MPGENNQDENYNNYTAQYKRALLAQIGVDSEVLEIGCGTFGCAGLYPASVRRVVGVEPDAGKHAAALAAAHAHGISLRIIDCGVRSLSHRPSRPAIAASSRPSCL